MTYTPSITVLRSFRTRDSNQVRRLIEWMITAPDDPKYRSPAGLPSWWPFYSDVIKQRTLELVRTARLLDLAEAKAHGYPPRLTELIHAFAPSGQALCGMGNKEDGDAPATHNPTEVTCPDCLARITP